MSLNGKIDTIGFDEFLGNRFGYHRNEVAAGPAFGVDVAVIDLPGDLALAITSDPLSLIPSLGLRESAWLSVHLMANDMATTGFAPMYAQMVLNLPVSLSKSDLQEYWNYIHLFCAEIGIAITGGHTGGIEGQESTIAGGGTMFLTAPRQEIRLSKFAKPGNLVIVTRECAMSSAAILAMSFPDVVRRDAGTQVYLEACDLFYKTTSLRDGIVAAGITGQPHAVTAMHDVTEGGVLGAVYEMAVASGNGVVIDETLLPISETVRSVCDLFELDPRFCIGAGAMIMAVEQNCEELVITQLREQHIPATVIGRFTDKSQGYKLSRGNAEVQLPYYPRDPYWAAFFKAINRGWK